MADETSVQWAYALGTWVRAQCFAKEAVFVIVWREYRETPWDTEQTYGLMGIEDIALPRDTIKLEEAPADELTPYDGDEDGTQHAQGPLQRGAGVPS